MTKNSFSKRGYRDKKFYKGGSNPFQWVAATSTPGGHTDKGRKEKMTMGDGEVRFIFYYLFFSFCRAAFTLSCSVYGNL